MACVHVRINVVFALEIYTKKSDHPKGKFPSDPSFSLRAVRIE